jgi:hypothetical protein
LPQVTPVLCCRVNKTNQLFSSFWTAGNDGAGGSVVSPELGLPGTSFVIAFFSFPDVIETKSVLLLNLLSGLVLDSLGMSGNSSFV